MKNILYLLLFFNTTYLFPYTSILTALSLKSCTELIHNLINCKSKELIEETNDKMFSHELIYSIRRESVNEKLLLYWNILKALLAPEVQGLYKLVNEEQFQELVQDADSLDDKWKSLDEIDTDTTFLRKKNTWLEK